MIILITGSSHTGKTFLAQQLLEKYLFPYLSIDHLKMGLIRSGYCNLSAESDDAELTPCLWPVVREIIKTNIENNQQLIVEGCYIPFDYRDDFASGYLKQIKFVCLIFSKHYIQYHYSDIMSNADIIEKRLDDHTDKNKLIEENERNLELCRKYGLDFILIDEKYDVNEMISHINRI